MRGPNADRRVLAAFMLLVLVGTNLVAIRYSNRELAPFWNAGFNPAAKAIAAAVPSAKRVTFEGQGHVADPLAVATVLVPFFEAT
jgi:hypothetical protein